MNQNDLEQLEKELEKARKKAEGILKLLPSQETLEAAKELEGADLDILPYSVASARQKTEEAQKKLERYTQLLKNLTIKIPDN